MSSTLRHLSPAVILYLLLMPTARVPFAHYRAPESSLGNGELNAIGLAVLVAVIYGRDLPAVLWESSMNHQ